MARSMAVTVPASSGPGQTCFNVGIIDDGSVESDEEFFVRFQIESGSSAQIGTVDSTCVRIVDDDDGRSVIQGRYTTYNVFYTSMPIIY